MAEVRHQQREQQDTQETSAFVATASTRTSIQSDVGTTGRGDDAGGAACPEDRFFSPDWFFPRYYIDHCSPSRRDGISLALENLLRRSYSSFLQTLGKELHMPQLTIATAIVFCHRFFLRQSHTRNDSYMIAAICMYLAGKVEETPEKLHNVMFLCYELLNNKDPAAADKIKVKDVYEKLKEIMFQGERLVLRTLGFELNVIHPYKHLVAAIKKFKLADKEMAQFSQIAWNFVNDGLQTSLPLQFRPSHVAAGALFLTTKFLKVQLPSEGDSFWSQEFKIASHQLEDCSNQLLGFYEQPNDALDPDTSILIHGFGIGTHDNYINHDWLNAISLEKLEDVDNRPPIDDEQQFLNEENAASCMVEEPKASNQEDSTGVMKYGFGLEGGSFNADGVHVSGNGHGMHAGKYYHIEDRDARYASDSWLVYEEEILQRDRKHVVEHELENWYSRDQEEVYHGQQDEGYYGQQDEEYHGERSHEYQDEGYHGQHSYSSLGEVPDWTLAGNPWPNHEEEFSERDWRDLPENRVNSYNENRYEINRKRRLYSSYANNGDWRSNSRSWAGYQEERHVKNGFRDELGDNRYRHNVQGRGYYNYNRPPRRDDAHHVDYHHQHRFRGWQDRDSKRARYQHGAG